MNGGRAVQTIPSTLCRNAPVFRCSAGRILRTCKAVRSLALGFDRAVLESMGATPAFCVPRHLPHCGKGLNTGSFCIERLMHIMLSLHLPQRRSVSRAAFPAPNFYSEPLRIAATSLIRTNARAPPESRASEGVRIQARCPKGPLPHFASVRPESPLTPLRRSDLDDVRHP